MVSDQRGFGCLQRLLCFLLVVKNGSGPERWGWDTPLYRFIQNENGHGCSVFLWGGYVQEQAGNLSPDLELSGGRLVDLTFENAGWRERRA